MGAQIGEVGAKLRPDFWEDGRQLQSLGFSGRKAGVGRI
jgi:hypothetical protein